MAIGKMCSALTKLAFVSLRTSRNAMSMLRKDREFKKVGVVESVFALEDFNVEVIADGIHVPPS